MSFFIRKTPARGQANKRKAVSRRGEKAPAIRQVDDEISSDSDREDRPEKILDDSDEEMYTVQEKRLMLAKKHLAEVALNAKKGEGVLESAPFVTDAFITQKLREEFLETTGRFAKAVADQYVSIDDEQIIIWKSKHTRDAVTVLVVSRNNDYVYVGTKNGNLIMYSIIDSKKLKTVPYKKTEQIPKPTVNAIAVSCENSFLAVAQGNNVLIKDANTLEQLHTFTGHTQTVTCLAFRKGAHELYSGSEDRSVKVWQVDLHHMFYVESLYGHQSGVTAIDALTLDTAITAGGYDTTLRQWQIGNDVQLVFNSHSHSVDCVKFLNEKYFVSGGSSGIVHVWSTAKKNPIAEIQNAHGINLSNLEPNWISAIGVVVNSDLFATGSNDGFVRIWKLSLPKIQQKLEIPIVGFVNSLQFTADGQKLIVGVAREHRLGRWWVNREAVNSVVVIPFVFSNK